MSVAVAVGAGLALAALKTAYVLTRDADALESLAVLVTLTIAAVAAVAAATRTAPARLAGLTAPGRWQSQHGVAAVAIGGLAAAVALSDAGPAVALRIVVGTALAEEILFRGVVYGLAERAEQRVAAAASGVTFGLWHVGDGWRDASDAAAVEQALVVVAVVLVTSLAGTYVFASLRRATGAIYAPALAHAALNLVGTLLLEAT